MRKNISGLDHVVILVRDLDAAQATYARLGFALTPRGFHSIGTHNHCIMFGTDYVELLALREPHPVTQYFSQFLAVAEGAAALAFSTDDAHAAHASLRASGVMADEPVDFSRPVDVDGMRRDARFRIVQLPVDETPGCRAFLCQHFTPDVVWRPEYQQHALGVVGVAGVSVRRSTTSARQRRPMDVCWPRRQPRRRRAGIWSRETARFRSPIVPPCSIVWAQRHCRDAVARWSLPCICACAIATLLPRRCGAAASRPRDLPMVH